MISPRILIFSFSGILLFSSTLSAEELQFSISNSDSTKTISPLIYGSNDWNMVSGVQQKFSRFGGNRLTGYNWEINASNAGRDWHHSSDDYLGKEDKPAGAQFTFIEKARALNTKTLITLQMAGFVAADFDGSINEKETAPSKRWIKTQANCPNSQEMDDDDDLVCMDQQIKEFVQKYGPASKGGVFGYSLDNEPALWNGTHSRLHPKPVEISELINKSIALASAVKKEDPSALVFGPALYGWAAFTGLQEAPDWKKFEARDTWFIDTYLRSMKNASRSKRVRLLDVLDIHWYPEASGNGRRIIFFGDDPKSLKEILHPEVNHARMQAPRSLWDTTYIEKSWITASIKSPIALLPRLNKSIEYQDSGVKLGITEWAYGGEEDVSGGIAIADALGIYGEQGVWAANLWAPFKEYSYAGFKLYGDVDGRGTHYGHLALSAHAKNAEKSSIHASFDSTGGMHLILINRDYQNHSAKVDLGTSKKVQALLKNTSSKKNPSISHWTFNQYRADIHCTQGTKLNKNTLEVELPALSAHHIVLSKNKSGKQQTSCQNPNLIQNPTMAAPGLGWKLETNGTEAEIKYSNKGAEIDIDRSGDAPWKLRLVQEHTQILPGLEYLIELTAQSSGKRPIQFCAGRTGHAWQTQSASCTSFNLNKELKTYRHRWVQNPKSKPGSVIEFLLGSNSKDILIRGISLKVVGGSASQKKAPVVLKKFVHNIEAMLLGPFLHLEYQAKNRGELIIRVFQEGKLKIEHPLEQDLGKQVINLSVDLNPGPAEIEFFMKKRGSVKKTVELSE